MEAWQAQTPGRADQFSDQQLEASGSLPRLRPLSGVRQASLRDGEGEGWQQQGGHSESYKFCRHLQRSRPGTPASLGRRMRSSASAPGFVDQAQQNASLDVSFASSAGKTAFAATPSRPPRPQGSAQGYRATPVASQKAAMNCSFTSSRTMLRSISVGSCGSRTAATPASTMRRQASRGGGATPSQRRPSRGNVGVTSQIQVHNVASTQVFEALLQMEFTDDDGRQASPMHTGELNLSADLEGFARESDVVAGSITDLQRRLAEFDPLSGGGKKDSLKRSRKNSGDDGPQGAEEEAAEKLQERLEAYKFSRVYDPLGCPPLEMLIGTAPKKPRDKAILERNAMPQSLKSWLPAVRKEKIADCAKRRELAIAHALVLRGQHEEEFRHAAADEVARKMAQATDAIHARFEGRPKQLGSEQVPFQQQWLSFVAAALFLKSVKEIKEAPKEEDRKPRRSKQRQSQVAGDPSEWTVEALDLPSFDILPTIVLTIQHFKKGAKARQEKRNCARMLMRSLNTWKTYGRLIAHMHAFLGRIRGLQQWWRDTAAKLRKQRDEVSKRWERLEHADLLREYVSRDPQLQAQLRANEAIAAAAAAAAAAKAANAGATATVAGSGQRGKAQPGAASSLTAHLDERIRMDMMTEVQRVRFIEHELRYRRYALLPEVALWEEDTRAWERQKQELATERDSFSAMGLDKDEAGPMFSFPPIRPTYMPAPHPESEAPTAANPKGCVCAPTCRGRQGDEEIMEMIRIARSAHPRGTGWQEVPKTKSTSALLAVGKTQRAASRSKIAASPVAEGDETSESAGASQAAKHASGEAAPADKIAGAKDGAASPGASRSGPRRKEPTARKETVNNANNSIFMEVDKQELESWGVKQNTLPCLQDEPG
eukprot:TRINITY_DN120790_c0_g1_i1.p1 TRINITY_DN120790_c0_g1~~TRINITY_DN120790_c0_g1_i1.p1  ORF type:complete len:884 (+),score=212.47 TRINITY_DN120790_c0_g1_i1:108-2759(+)